MFSFVVVMVMVFVFQNPCARDIDGQSQTRDDNSLIKLNRKRMNESPNGFTGHHQTDATQNNRAGKCAQHAELSRSETKVIIRRVSSGKEIGQDGYQEGSDMSSHVQAIGKQSH